jgi:hypothetical protein
VVQVDFNDVEEVVVELCTSIVIATVEASGSVALDDSCGVESEVYRYVTPLPEFT